MEPTPSPSTTLLERTGDVAQAPQPTFQYPSPQAGARQVVSFAKEKNLNGNWYMEDLAYADDLKARKIIPW